MSLIEMLKEDHRMTISRAWPVVAGACDRMRKGQEVSLQSLGRIVMLLRGFVLEHHLPAEDAVLRLIHEHGIDQEDPSIDKIIMEHEEAKNYIENLSDDLQAATQGNGAAKAAFADDGSEFIAFLVKHETEENEYLFPLLEGVLTDDDRRDLQTRFAAVEKEQRERESEDPHRRYGQLLKQLEIEFEL